MKRLGLPLLILGGVVLLSGVVVASAAPPASPTTVTAQNTPPEGATFVGSNTCFNCHSTQHRDWATTLHSKMIQDVSIRPAALVADFASGEEFRMVEIDGTERAFTAEDVTFTLGNKYRQRYIMKTDSGYAVLPGQWNIADQKWVMADPGDWLKSCAGCHTTGFDAAQQTFSEISVGCEACHGPGSVHVETARALPIDVEPVSDAVYAVRETIVKTVDSAVCGACHTRGTSPDGQHGYPVGYVVGGPLDETMFKPVVPRGTLDDPDFWPDGSEKKHRQQYLTFMASGHGSKTLAQIQEFAYGADRCMACHSTDFALQDRTFPQDVVTKDTAQFNITCVHCHAPHGEQHIEDQLVGESYALCVSCHTGTGLGRSPIRVGADVHHPMREMYEGVSFLGLRPNPSPHFANEAYGPVCASCHMVRTAKSADLGDIASHTFKLILPTEAAEGQPDSCTTCHTLARNPDNTKENLTFAVEQVQQETRRRVETLRADLKEIMDEHPEWDPQATEKSADQLKAERVHTMLTFIEADGSWGFHNPGYTKDILDAADRLLDEIG